MITVEHVGPLVYGGAVTLTDWYDNKRISEGKITDADVLKKFGMWTYLGIGVASLVATVWWRKYQGWTDRLTAGFLYGLPGFLYKTIKSTQGATTGGSSAAVAEANRVLARKTASLPAGTKTSRSYEPEFKKSVAY
jgi:hypothetical protein